MKILVINLDEQSQRLAFQNTQMKQLGLTFDRLRATQISDLNIDDMNAQISQWERPMRPAEVACLASHRAAWQIVIEKNAPVLILEDDALLCDHTPQLLADLVKITNMDHVSLEARSRKKLLATKPLHVNEHTNLSRLYQDRTGAAAYVLWPRGAEILLENSSRAAGLADAIIAAAYKMSSWQVEPAAAIQLDQCQAYGLNPVIDTTTTIGTGSHEKPKPMNLAVAIIFKYRRIKSQLRMGLRHLLHITKANRRFVTVETAHFQAHIDSNNSR